MSPRIVFLAALLPGLGACAATRTPAPRFPSEATVAEWAAQSVAAAPDAVPVTDVAEWKLTGPLPDVVETRPHVGGTAWDGLLGESATGESGSLSATEAAACAAREIGLFRAAQPGAPSLRLLRFMAARCGLVAPIVATGCRVSSAGEGASDREVLASDGPAVKAALQSASTRTEAPSVEAGIWVGRKDAHPLICWVTAPRWFEVKRATMVPDDDARIAIEGDLPLVDAQAAALISAGRLGTWPCDVVSAQPPRLSISCHVHREDAAAWVDVTASRADEIGGRTVLSLMAWPRGKPDDTYRRLPPAGDGAAPACEAPTSATGAAIEQAVVACINQARKSVHAQPLVVAPDQARTVAALVPRWFAVQRGGDAAVTLDQLALGLRAGWQANTELSFGALADTAQEGTPDPAALITALFELPTSRAALLDPQAGLVAVGAASLPGLASTGVIAAVYRTVDEKHPLNQAAYTAQVFTRINAARAARGLEPATFFDGDRGHTVADAAKVTSGQFSLLRAISDAAEAGAYDRKLGHAHGWTRAFDDPSTLAIPEALLISPELAVAVGVGRYRRPGEPWARPVALLVLSHQTCDYKGADVGVVASSHFYAQYGM